MDKELSYTDRSQQVIDNKRSDSCNVLSGVPQGTFLIYINDLPLHISNKVHLYVFCIHISTLVHG